MFGTSPISLYDNSSWRIADFFLQAAHRVGSAGLISLVIAGALIYAGQEYRWPIAIGFALADVGLCAAIAARFLGQFEIGRRRESLGVGIFNIVLIVASLILMILSSIPRHSR
jgi:hypothetical protein